MALIRLVWVPALDRFVAIRFKQIPDSCLIRFLLRGVPGAAHGSIWFDSKRFFIFRFRTGSIPDVQRFGVLNRFGTILRR